MKRPGPRARTVEEKSHEDLERENELVKAINRDLAKKVEFLEEELRILRHTQHAVARRASWGNGCHQ